MLKITEDCKKLIGNYWVDRLLKDIAETIKLINPLKYRYFGSISIKFYSKMLQIKN